MSLVQHSVSIYDNTEQDMYSKAKGAESDRKKHDQMLNKMHEDLTYLKRENARRLKVIRPRAVMLKYIDPLPYYGVL